MGLALGVLLGDSIWACIPADTGRSPAEPTATGVVVWVYRPADLAKGCVFCRFEFIRTIRGRRCPNEAACWPFGPIGVAPVAGILAGDSIWACIPAEAEPTEVALVLGVAAGVIVWVRCSNKFGPTVDSSRGSRDTEAIKGAGGVVAVFMRGLLCWRRGCLGLGLAPAGVCRGRCRGLWGPWGACRAGRGRSCRPCVARSGSRGCGC